MNDYKQAMTANKQGVQRYTDMGSETICPINNMRKSDDGNYVLYEDYERLQAECERLRKLLQHMIDQTTPLEPEPGNPMWSRRIQLDEVIAERDSLRAEYEKLLKDVSALVEALEEIRGLPSVRQDEAAFIAGSALDAYRKQGGEV